MEPCFLCKENNKFIGLISISDRVIKPEALGIETGQNIICYKCDTKVPGIYFGIQRPLLKSISFFLDEETSERRCLNRTYDRCIQCDKTEETNDGLVPYFFKNAKHLKYATNNDNNTTHPLCSKCCYYCEM
jgi:hypothetical protein